MNLRVRSVTGCSRSAILAVVREIRCVCLRGETDGRSVVEVVVRGSLSSWEVLRRTSERRSLSH